MVQVVEIFIAVIVTYMKGTPWYSLLDGLLVHGGFSPNIKFAGTHLYL